MNYGIRGFCTSGRWNNLILVLSAEIRRHLYFKENYLHLYILHIHQHNQHIRHEIIKIWKYPILLLFLKLKPIFFLFFLFPLIIYFLSKFSDVRQTFVRQQPAFNRNGFKWLPTSYSSCLFLLSLAKSSKLSNIYFQSPNSISTIVGSDQILSRTTHHHHLAYIYIDTSKSGNTRYFYYF